MRTFLRLSLLGNAFLDLACILLLLSHGRGNPPRNAAASPQPAEVRATVADNDPIGVFAIEASFAQSDLPGSFPAELLDGNMILAESVQLDGLPKYITAYEVDWRFEGKPLDLRLGGASYPRSSP